MFNKISSIFGNLGPENVLTEGKELLANLMTGKLLVPQRVLEHSTHESLHGTEMTLNSLQCHEGFVELNFNTSKLPGVVRLSEVILTLSLVSVGTSAARQTCELTLHSASACGEGPLSRIIVWFVQQFFQSRLQAMIKEKIVDSASGKELSVAIKQDNGNLEVDFTQTPWAKRFAAMKPNPFSDKSIFDLLQVEQIGHHPEGIKLKLAKLLIGNRI